jgi:hypothetical protein
MKAMENVCPNYGGCRLVRTEVVVPDDKKRKAYLETYCVGEDKFKSCKRYITKKSLWICPDFVLPDSDMTEDEIAEKYESEG